MQLCKAASTRSFAQDSQFITCIGSGMGIEMYSYLDSQSSFKRFAEESQSITCIAQAWALLEAEDRNLGKARELLEKGSHMDPWHIPIWQAWGVLEFRNGNIEQARALFQEVSQHLVCALFVTHSYFLYTAAGLEVIILPALLLTILVTHCC